MFLSPSFFRGYHARMAVPVTMSCEASETGCGVLSNNGLMFEYRKENISNGRLSYEQKSNHF